MTFPSIHDESIAPLETGGVVARDGFDFQDHVVARFCLELLTNFDLLEVWCESQDDITLIWGIDGNQINEFVQVKGNKLAQFWSTSLLCRREKKKDLTGMSNYLYLLEAQGKNLWTQGRINFKLKKRDFDVKVENQKWSTKLDGTLTLYFFLAYHYALMELTKAHGNHYPGLSILDLPPTLEDGSTVKDNENFVLEPFVKLLSQPNMENTQVIVTGAAFENLEGANRIEFTQVWK